MSVQEIDRGWKAIKVELQKANALEVAVGILEGSENNGQSIAEYAAANEFGTDKMPSRPFTAVSFDENKKAIEQDFRRLYAQITEGKQTTQNALVIAGQKHAERVKKTITGRDFLPKLKPATVKAKKGSTKTLVDTGAMVNSVKISVRSK